MDQKKAVLSHGQMKAMKAKADDARREKYLEQSRRRLDRIITTKMKTAFIGALSAFEDEFGFLWGQDLPENALSQEQKDMAELWERARTRVLNNGNTQLRAVRTEIQNHTVDWKRYRMDFAVKPQGEEQHG